MSYLFNLLLGLLDVVGLPFLGTITLIGRVLFLTKLRLVV